MIKLFAISLFLFIVIPFVAIADNENITAPSAEEDYKLQEKISSEEWDKGFYADIEKRFGKEAVIKMKKNRHRAKIIDALIYTVVIILFIIGIVGVGLNKKLNTIHSKLCLGVFSLAIIFAVYSVFYAGEQGAVGLIFIPIGIGLPCFIITVILWIVQFFKRNKSINTQ